MIRRLFHRHHNQKEQRREQRKLERQISECENEIETLETTILQIDEQLTSWCAFNASASSTFSM
jgi:ATP-binding cassette subfamily F protein 3